MCALDFRLYYCARCYCQVEICRSCDRGNIYCNRGCSLLARQESKLHASHRYQKSRIGRFKHAKRQHRYLTRKNNKMTHLGSSTSAEKPYSSLLKKAPFKEKRDAYVGNICHFCGRIGSLFLRNGFLKHVAASERTKKRTKASRLNKLMKRNL